MRLTVIGCGYLGAVHAAAMAELGHHVLGIETDPARLERLAQGESPFYEPGLEELLRRGAREGRLRYTDDPAHAELAGAAVHFLAVGTPQSPSGRGTDLSCLWEAVDALATALPRRQHLAGLPLVVGKSTVPVGTAARVADRLAGRALVVWNPEFLREGTAVADTLRPDRLVYGLPARAAQAARARSLLDEVYIELLVAGVPRLEMDYQTAELVKTAANSFLATKISFINAMSSVCAAAEADVAVLADAIGRDERIGGQFLRAGIGFGGGCLPKDLRGLGARAAELGVTELASFLEQVDAINRGQRDLVTRMALDALGGDPAGRAVTVLGITFKPASDDLRDSPALDVALRLADAGADVTVHDPEGLPGLSGLRPALRAQPDALVALEGADLVILGTEWEELTGLDPAAAARRVARRVIIDARNALVPSRWTGAGWDYRGIGRPRPPQQRRVPTPRRCAGTIVG